MPEPTTLNAADIRRAYICPTWFKKHLEITYELDPPDSPQEVTRWRLENWLPGILTAHSAGMARAHILDLFDDFRPAIQTAWEQSEPEYCGLFEDVWLREKNLFAGVAALAVTELLAQSYDETGYMPGILDDVSFRPSPVALDDEGVIRYRVTSKARSEDQWRSDVALGCEAHAWGRHDYSLFRLQEIVIGWRAEQWYENPLCRYWRHDNGSVSITGLTPDGKQCRAPHWRKVPVFSPESTDPNEIETMWQHVEWLTKQPEFNPGEILPDPVVMEIGDHQQAQFANALRVLEQGFAETPIRNYTACDNPLFFPHGCPLKKECWG